MHALLPDSHRAEKTEFGVAVRSAHRQRRALFGLARCTPVAAPVNLGNGRADLWKQITAELNGHSVTGLYSASGEGLVTVRTPYDSKSRELVGSTATLIARILLRELATEGITCCWTVFFQLFLLHCNEYFASKNLKIDTICFYGLLSRVSREPFGGERVVVHSPQQLYVGHPGHDERTLMSDAEQRDTAEALFTPKQSHEEIKDAIKLEEARRAAMVKNLYRLRSLRLSRNQASTKPKK